MEWLVTLVEFWGPSLDKPFKHDKLGAAWRIPDLSRVTAVFLHTVQS